MMRLCRPFIVKMIALVAMAVSSGMQAWSHGQHDEKAELLLAAAGTSVTAAVPGAREFAIQIEQHAAVSLFGDDDIPAALAAARQVRLASELAAAGVIKPASTASIGLLSETAAVAERARSLAEAQLGDSMETAKNLIELNLNGDLQQFAYSYQHLQGDPSYLLLKVIGPDATYTSRVALFSYREINLEKQTEIDPPLNLRVSYTGVTWLLLKVSNAPVGRTREFVNFVFSDKPDAPTFRSLMGFEAQLQGQLRVELIDEDGTSVPAMVRLVSKRDGLLRRPEGALDFSAMTDDISSGPTAGLNLPEPLKVAPPFGGFYWVVDGGFQMSLPEGSWEIFVHRGPETIPLRETVEVDSSAGLTSRQMVLKRWENMASRGWWSGDDHVHSRLTSDEDARRLMTWVKAADIHVANVLRMGNRMRTYYEQRGFGPEYRWIDGDRALVPGQEDPRYSTGHCIGLNLTAPVRDEANYLRTDWVAETIHAQGGLFGHAHVSHAMFGVAYDMTLTLIEGNSDFGSIMQGPHFNTRLYYDFLNLGFRLTASSGSDTPYSSSIGESRIYAFIGEGTPFSADSWFDAVGKGRTFVTNGPMLDLRVNDAVPGDEIVVEPGISGQSVRVQAKAWGLANASAPVELRLVVLGKPVKTVIAESDDTTELTCNFALPAGNGYWIAAYARSKDGSEAHTTPIYVVREGLRTWNLDQVPQLLARRYNDLNAIQAMLKQQQAKAQSNETWFADVYNRGMADDAEQMLERISRARSLYKNLEELARSQRSHNEATTSTATSQIPSPL